MWIIVRTVGMLCILAACILTGFVLEQRLKRREQLFREMQETMTFLEKETTYHRSPIHEAFRSVQKHCMTALSGVFSEVAAQVEQRNGQSFQKIWEDALARFIPDGLLTQDEMQLFVESSAALCNTDVVMQKTLLGKYADRFRLMSEEEEQLCREKGGLYRRLTVAAGIFLVILLL